MAIVSPTFTADAGWSATTPQGIQYRAYVIWRLNADVYKPPAAIEYVTDDLIEPPTFVRGRSVDGVSLGNIEVGQCSMTVLNGRLDANGNRIFDGRYSRRNKSSPLNQESETTQGEIISWVGAGRYVAIDVRDPAYPNTVSRLWTGVLTDIISDTSDPLLPTVTLTSQGVLYLFSDEDATINKTERTSQLALGILKPSDKKYARGLGDVKVPTSYWETRLTDFEESGGALGVLGSLEVMEATGRVYENKKGEVVLAGLPSATTEAVFYDAPIPNNAPASPSPFRISSAHEVNAEALIFDCFNYSVQVDVTRDKSDDVTNAHDIAPTQEAPTDDNGQPNNGVFSDHYVFKPDDDYSGIRWLPEETIFQVKFAADAAGLAAASVIKMRYGTLTDGTTTHQWNRYRFRTSSFVKVNEQNRNKIEWELRRTGTLGNLKAWLVGVQLFGVREELVEKGEPLERCVKRASVIDQVGERKFPIEPTFHNLDEAQRWVGIMAVRYSEERLRLSVEVVPTDAEEFMELSKLELGERVQLELTGTEPSSSRLYIDSGKTCVIERIEHVPTDGFASAFVIDLLDSSYYDDKVMSTGGFPPSSLSPTGDP